jgi:hypothetical protein
MHKLPEDKYCCYQNKEMLHLSDISIIVEEPSKLHPIATNTT